MKQNNNASDNVNRMTSTFSDVNIKNNNLMMPAVLNRRNSMQNRSKSKLAAEWIIQTNGKKAKQQHQNSDNNSHRDSYHSYEYSEQSSDTGVESISFNSNNTPSIDETIFPVDNIQTNSDSISSTSSLNSEEGYYSNHDTSVMTLIDEDQLNKKKTSIEILINQSPPRTVSYPEIAQHKTLKLLKIEKQNNKLPQSEIFNSSCNVIDTLNESLQMNVKNLSSMFDKNVQKSTKNSSTLTLNSSMFSSNEYSNDEQEFIYDLSSPFKPRLRSVSAYIIHSPTNSDKIRHSTSNFNSIKRIGNNSFKVEKFNEANKTENDEFLLRDAFGSRFLMEAKNFFGNGIRDLIMKFENKK